MLLTVLATLLVAAAGRGVGQIPSARPLPLNLDGRPVDPFRAPQAKVQVFLFVRTDCPISNRYAPEIQRLYEEFSPKGVAFWLVYPDPHETPETIRKHAQEYHHSSRPLRDPEHALARMTGVQVTPEVAVFVSGRTGQQMIYRGRIDDWYVDFGKARPAPTTHDLENVLGQIVAGRQVTPETTHAIGCFISDLK
jgi:hypothetical protein